jgi:Flp pilus assembly protein CpaB
MATLSPPRSTNGVRTPRRAGARVAQVGRRRQLSVAIVGAFLVVGGALAFADASLHLGSRQGVLVTTRALTAGEVLDTSDLTTAAISTNSGLQFVAANEESIVVGRPLAVPLVAGVPITTGEVGSLSSVVAGSDVVAVLLKPGGYPPSLSPGDRVEVVPVAPTGSVAPPSTNSLPATVLSVSADPSDADGSSVIGLQVQSSLAATVAQLAAAGEASLVQLGASS